ncbi:hypothetical protein NO989_21660 [Alteromonas sp. DY56-G5]|jgi:hypothetical protein|uniref:hypothetical protein n=1 Tax=Alteromonas sp. DY56-G5 TaxID=2967128 RepID=UPI00352B189C|tara:strand:- start:680 stop:1174 length:495 start_codon:yes stop_codon:yes gene_type:complete
MDRTLEYVKDRYNEEQSRFKHVEDKCSKLLTFLTVVISALIAILSIKNNTFLSPSNPLEWIRTSIFCLTGFCVFCAWGHALLALKIGDCPNAPISRTAANYIKDTGDEERDLFIFDCYVDTTQQLKMQIDYKINYLEYSYSELAYSAWGIGLISFISIFMELSK